MAALNAIRTLITVIWGDWQSNTLWQRILKYTIACTIAIIIAILPHFKANSTFLTPMVVVFAHPAQRLGVMLEALLMILFGSLLGLSWSLLGLYLSGLVEDANPPAAYTIRALFLLGCVLLHGFVRSMSPRLFNFVLFLLLSALLTIQLPTSATASLFTTIYIPVLLGGGVLVVVNLAIFPELSSRYLGTSTIDTLSSTVDTLTRATHWFITPGGDAIEARSHLHPLAATATHSTIKRAKNKFLAHVRTFFADFPNPFHTAGASAGRSAAPIHLTTLAYLTGQKSRLRTQLSSCKKVQDEVDFEISVSPLAPATMKGISLLYMTTLVQNVVTLIGACENKYILVDDGGLRGYGADTPVTVESKHQTGLAQNTQPMPSGVQKRSRYKGQANDGDKPLKEIEAGSYQLLEMTLRQIRNPVQDFMASMKEAVHLLTSCLAYCFDVPQLPGGTPAPKGIQLEEIDMRIDEFSEAIATFDRRSAEELKVAVMGESGQAVDFMPRMETFLVSSFLLAYQGSATQILEMLRHARKLVSKKQRRYRKSQIWIPQFRNLRQWLATGGETDGLILPEEAKKSARQGLQPKSAKREKEPLDEVDTPPMTGDEESLPCFVNSQAPAQKRPARSSHRSKKFASDTRARSIRAAIADAIEWVKRSDDVDYALKLAVAVFLVTWPALVASWNGWYAEVKGVWAPMQLILVFEVAIGTSLFVFAVRLFGVVFGCLVGYLSVEIGRGNRAAAVVILLFGIVPSVYVQIATKYVKAGMISIVSMAVVALAAVSDVSIASEIFYKRLVAFLVGGLVAMVVEAVITPVRARDRLVESLSAAVRQIQKMQAAVFVGVDDPDRPNFRSEKLFSRFRHCRDKAHRALVAADTFLPFCLTEPRLKGSFKPLAPTYKQIIHILQQIIDRMDNMIQLRRVYGSSILEDLNCQVYTYRRNVAASSALILFSVNEALTNWLPLPQFIPSARLAQLRLINRIRGLLLAGQDSKGVKGRPSLMKHHHPGSNLDEETAYMITQRKFLSWNASTAGQMEIIEYLEELVDLVKLLVGVNAFRSGMLERPQYRQCIRQLETEHGDDLDRVNSEQVKGSGQANHGSGVDVPRPEGSESIAQLRRAATVSQHGEGFQFDSEADAEAGEDLADDVRYTQMLRRVGTRLRRSDTLVRRRGFTISHSSKSS
ncbi:hypothetical protein QQS21_010502 [Conoideocrella luteorostrata]|uniref:Integral membrane bound transporter domain-containing protein n=1 Tax=Conoideocrella luteorostrata TaxID=1105319 RepID=A0AAJ0CJC6_9HYPO|nr:hypothetical protein QQS21_010502 [Conoideocrella luteorostrata]